MDQKETEEEGISIKKPLKQNFDHLSPAGEIRGTTSLLFTDIMATMLSIKSEEFSRITGIIAHLSYWQVFGSLNSIQPDDQTKKQMVVACYDQLHVLRRKSKVFSFF